MTAINKNNPVSTLSPLAGTDLTWGEAAVEKVSNVGWALKNSPFLAWGCVKNIGTYFGKKAVNYALTTAQPVVHQAAHPELEKAHRYLKSLLASVNVAPELRKEIAKNLRTLLGNESQILQNSVQANNTVLWFSTRDKKVLIKLCQVLESNQPLHPLLVQRALSIIEPRRNLQLGLFESALEAGLSQFRPSLGVTSSHGVATSSALETNNQDRIRELITPRVKPPLRPANMVEINKEANLVKSNLTKMILGQYILFTVCGIKDEDQLTTMIESANVSGTKTTEPSEVIFKRTMYNIIDKSDCLLTTKLWAKFTYWFCAPLFQFYINTIVDNVMQDAVALLGKNKDERLKEIISILIDPANSYLMTLASLYQNYATSTDIKTMTAEENIMNFVNGKKDPAALTKQVTNLIMTRYVPTLWKTRWFLLQPLAYFTVKKIVSDVALPSLLNTSKTAIGIGGAYLHLINEFIFDQLCELKEKIRTGQLPTASTDELSLLSKEPFNRLIESAFGVLDLQRADNGNGLSLTKKVTSDGLLHELEQKVDDLLFMAVKDTAKKQVISLAQLFTEKEFLENLFLTSLTSLNATFKPNMKPTDAQKKETEVKMFNVLNELINMAVSEAVEEQLHPEQKIQKEANAFIDQMKQKIHAFAQTAATTREIASIRALHDKFLHEIQDLQKKAKEGTNESTMVVINQLQKEFLDRFEALSRNIVALSELKAQESEKRSMIASLQQLHLYLQTNDLDQLLKLLRIVPLTNYPNTVQGDIQLLKKSIEDDCKPLQRKHQAAVSITAALHLNRGQINMLMSEIEANREALALDVKPLTAWTDTLEHFVTTGGESTALSLAGAVVGPGLKNILVGKIMTITQELFKFVGKEYNWDGLGTRVIQTLLPRVSR